MIETTHLRFVDAPPKPKTKVWQVLNKHDDIHLGWVGWFGRWRKYAFFPGEKTVYEEVCLRDIAKFCEDRTKEHRKQEFDLKFDRKFKNATRL